MDERVKRLEDMFSEYIELADGIHADPAGSEYLYDELRPVMSMWNLTVRNVTWLTRMDMNDTDTGHIDNTVSTRQIKACLGANQYLIERKYITVDREELEELEIAGNPDLTVMIWQNLLQNAIKFTDKFGHIWISAKRNGDYAEILFRDDGIGIPEERIDSIFERYTQFSESDSRIGLGLGLAVVKEATTVLNGDVSCISKLHRGTTVKVRIPIAKGN